MQDLLLYNYSSWQPLYAKNTFKSMSIDITPDFVAFLQEGGIVVSSSTKALPQRCQPTELVVEGVDYNPEDTYSSDDEQSAYESGSDDARGNQDHMPWSERFPVLHAEIESAIAQLGGQVAPKLNWSSPTDALWISSYNSLKCCNADQVILLLKSSDRVMHDLEQLQPATQQHQHSQQQPATDDQQPMKLPQQPQQQQQTEHSTTAAGPLLVPQVVLRQWHDLLPEREFRCFIHQHHLTAISQRDVSQHFPQLTMTGQLDNLKQQIQAFHQQHTADSFPVESYVMDIYVPISGSSIKIMDFNPVCDTTSPLLFAWDELPYTCMRSTAAQQQPPPPQQQQQQQQQRQQQQRQQQQRQDVQKDSFAGQQEHSTAGVDVELRVVSHAGMIMPGARAATGMPLDMLGLQNSFEQMLHTRQKQEEEQQL